MELKKINERVYYIPNAANIGLIKDGNKVILIDSGLDEGTGRKILRLLEEKNMQLSIIINTHSHADHCGGNQFIKKRTGALIYAPEIESEIISQPILEPLYLFSGAKPLESLQNKFLMAQASNVDYIIKGSERLSFNEVKIDIIPLPGHSPNQIGVLIDKILFCADSIFSKEVLEKHKIPFFTDINKTKETLIFLRDSDYDYYVPSHAQPCKSISELATANLNTIINIEEQLLKLCNGKSTEDLTKELLDHYQIKINSVQQYFLMKTVVMAYLSYLNDDKKIKTSVQDNKLFWTSK